MAATALFRLSPVSRPWPHLQQPEMWEPGVPAISDFVALVFLGLGWVSLARVRRFALISAISERVTLACAPKSPKRAFGVPPESQY